MVHPSPSIFDSSVVMLQPGLESVAFPHTIACIVTFSTVLYSRTSRESWKEFIRYFPLVLLIAKHSQSPSSVRVTQLGLWTVANPILGEQKPDDSHGTDPLSSAIPHQQTEPLSGKFAP